MDDIDRDVARMWRHMVYGRWLGRGIAVAILAAVVWDANAQPVPVPAGETGVTVEIRYKNASGTTVKLRRLPGDGFSVPNLSAAAYTHEEPCWNKASNCQIASVTIKTFYKLPAGLNANWTSWWCNTNSSGECPMPAFPAVTIKPGEKVCMAFDRVKAEWRTPPVVCPMIHPVAPVSFADSYGATWSLGALCAGSTTQRTVLANGTATTKCSDELKLNGGLVYWRTAPDQGWVWTGRP
jgi:hypothetical protein